MITAFTSLEPSRKRTENQKRKKNYSDTRTLKRDATSTSRTSLLRPQRKTWKDYSLNMEILRALKFSPKVLPVKALSTLSFVSKSQRMLLKLKINYISKSTMVNNSMLTTTKLRKWDKFNNRTSKIRLTSKNIRSNSKTSLLKISKSQKYLNFFKCFFQWSLNFNLSIDKEDQECQEWELKVLVDKDLTLCPDLINNKLDKCLLQVWFHLNKWEFVNLWWDKFHPTWCHLKDLYQLLLKDSQSHLRMLQLEFNSFQSQSNLFLL